jgi:general secretion pathway protein G
MKVLLQRHRSGQTLIAEGRRRGEGGYSLLELLVVLAILGLIISIAAPRVIGYFETSKGKIAKIQISNLQTSLDMYLLSMHSYPTQEQGLEALLEAPAGADNWNGPYLTRKDGIVDPWGRPYVYKIPGTHGKFDITTLGADGKEGGTDEDQDLGSW